MSEQDTEARINAALNAMCAAVEAALGEPLVSVAVVIETRDDMRCMLGGRGRNPETLELQLEALVSAHGGEIELISKT